MINSSLSIKTKYKRDVLFIYISLFVVVCGAIVLPPILEYAMILLFLFVIGVIAVNSRRFKDSLIWCHLLSLPVFLSAFQNIYLGMAAYKLTSAELQLLLSLNIILFLMYVIIGISDGRTANNISWVIGLMVALILQSIGMFLVYPSAVTAFVSCLRNILACLVIYSCTTRYVANINIESFYRIIEKIIIVVLVFGVLEYFVVSDMWIKLNISKLWPLKGIAVNNWGFPKNWWSSERIGGRQLRRMVSSFADPVNLGTFLFSAFMYAWYKKRTVLCLSVFAACVLTISKGALLGFLVFVLVWTWNNKRMKALTPIMLLSVLCIGLSFVAFSRKSSSGSMFAHIDGLTNSILIMKDNPFGVGVGNVGVLAHMFNANNSMSLAAAETGIGMIIAQLGFIGLLVYFIFFSTLFRNSLRLKKEYSRERIFSQTLIFAFLGNVLFNEVALSPNSCALYFIFLGIIEGKRQKDK